MGTGWSSYCVKNDGSGGGGGCPVECRANSCGTGYEDAAGCGPITATTPNFGCKSNQACCRPKTCSGGGGGGTTCPVPESCPPGTIRLTNIKSTQCLPSNCEIGTAQTRGDCCSEKKIKPQICGEWYKCPTPSNPNKMCRDCTEEEWVCDGYSVVTYACMSIHSPTPTPRPPSPTPTTIKSSPTPTPTPKPLVCESLNAFCRRSLSNN